MEKDKFYEDRLHAIKSNLFNGDEKHMGGEGLKTALVHCLLSEGTLDLEGLFSSISQLYREKEETIKDGGIFPVDMFEHYFQPKEHMVYPCLDNELRFKMLHYGEADWEDALYVFAYLNIDKAWNIVQKRLGKF